MPRFFATTSRGLEDVAAGEVRGLLGCNVREGVGRVFFEAGLDAIPKLNLHSRTIHKVLLLLCRGSFETLNDVYAMAKRVDYTEFVDPERSFAVRAERSGVHPFTSMDVAASVGQAVIDSYMEATGRRLRVNLDQPDVEFLCLVRGSEFVMGLNTTGASLHRRHYRVYDHPAALKTTIASAMIKLSGWKPSEPLLDPLCGGATIPIEAALIARRVPPGVFRGGDFAFLRLKFLDPAEFWEMRERALEEANSESFPIYGLDKSLRYLEGASMNVESAGVGGTVTLLHGDATNLREYIGFTPRFVITNPPYGIRMRKPHLRTFYRNFLKSLVDIASGGTLLLITAATKRFSEAAEAAGVGVEWRRTVYHGNVKTVIFKCTL